jgi:hypothetical protein
MKRTATPDEITHAAAWLKARQVTLAEEPVGWYFGEDVPDPLRIVLDTNYGGGNECTFRTRDEAMNALAVTLANFKAAHTGQWHQLAGGTLPRGLLKFQKAHHRFTMCVA